MHFPFLQCFQKPFYHNCLNLGLCGIDLKIVEYVNGLVENIVGTEIEASIIHFLFSHKVFYSPFFKIVYSQNVLVNYHIQVYTLNIVKSVIISDTALAETA